MESGKESEENDTFRGFAEVFDEIDFGMGEDADKVPVLERPPVPVLWPGAGCQGRGSFWQVVMAARRGWGFVFFWGAFGS
jgi:hypothetical protein